MSEGKTFNKMTLRELMSAYTVIVEAFKEKRYTPDQPGYNVMVARLQNIENELRQRKPEYLDRLKDKEKYESVLDNNYTIEQLAEVFNVTRQTVYNWMHRGIIPTIKFGGKTYISKVAVERVMKNGALAERTST